MEVLSIVLVVLILSGLAGMFVGAWIVFDDAPEWQKQRERRLRAELEGLRANHRLNVAFWRAKEELDVEADRQRNESDWP
ncbi:MAG: hypothetical protein ACREX3_00110 [Gammaproteobacteria bacterium]